ncbi:MAG: hypothetical protein PHG08_00565 [Bacilli bacterium]|nr:hypothetical protein [Bacilli bacterium]
MTTRKKYIKWTEESLGIEALKYNSISEFKKNNDAAYHACRNFKLVDKLCSHMQSKYNKWDIDSLQKEALKFNTRNEFRELSNSAYQSACRGNLLDIICKHMESPQIQWDKDSILLESQKYETRTEFAKGNYNAYQAAIRIDIDLFCQHMDKKIKQISWSDEMIFKEALKFGTRNEFKLNSGAYRIAIYRNILDDVCEHMSIQRGGFNKNKSATLYYIKFVTQFINLYKIGVTNRSTPERLWGLILNNGVNFEILSEQYFQNGQDALDLERKIKQENKKFRYNGEPVLQNGNTELFIKDILGVDNQPKILYNSTSKIINKESAE